MAYGTFAALYWPQRTARAATYRRDEVLARWGGTCAYCDEPAEHLDHVVPLCAGGADAEHNIVPACAACNLSKGALSLADWALSWSA